MFHTIIIVGNVGKDPEMRYTPSGQAVTSFSVATNRQYTGNNGEQVKETIWFRVSTWGKTAEVCNQYVKKGSKVLVEGRLTPDKNTGGPRIWTKPMEPLAHRSKLPHPMYASFRRAVKTKAAPSQAAVAEWKWPNSHPKTIFPSNPPII